MRRAERRSSILHVMHRMGLVLGVLLAASARCQTGEGIRALTPAPANLEGKWAFRIDPEDVGLKSGWQKPEMDDSAWEQLRVPGYWEPQGVTQARPGEGPRTMKGVRWTDYDGIAWYRLRFTVPKEWLKEKELFLRLGSVDDRDHAYLNGQLVGQTGEEVPRSVSVQRQYNIAQIGRASCRERV